MLAVQQSPVFAEFDGLTVEPPFAVANFAGEQVDVVSADTPVVDVFAEHGFRYFRGDGFHFGGDFLSHDLFPSIFLWVRFRSYSPAACP